MLLRVQVEVATVHPVRSDKKSITSTLPNSSVEIVSSVYSSVEIVSSVYSSVVRYSMRGIKSMIGCERAFYT